jgi:hypothetical protein
MHYRRLSLPPEFFAAVLAAVLGVAALTAVGPAAPPAAAAATGGKKVIVNLFEWSWSSVANECQSFLGPRGYGYVQVSPPQEHIKGQQWWVAYQPVSLVAFHNAVDGMAVVNWYDNGNNHVAFGRGSRGYLTINDEDSAVNGRRYHSNLPAGRYCDVIHGDYTSGSCTGPVITVDASGWFQADVPAHDAVALHTGAKVG